MAFREPKHIPGSVCLGVIAGARGLTGELKIKPFSDDPLGFGAYGALHDGAGRRLVVRPRSMVKGMLMAMIDGITDRTAADAMRGTALYIERENLPEPDEDEFYHADLIGLHAKGLDGTDFGIIKSVDDFGAGDVLELKGPVHGTLVIPFTRQCVPLVDLAAKQVTIDPPPGLLEPGEPEPQQQPEQAAGDGDES